MRVLVTNYVTFKVKTPSCWVILGTLVMMIALMGELVTSLNGDHICIAKQKYNITKRVKYLAPVAVRTYSWCMAMPPRCSKWTVETRELSRLETDERIAEVQVCCEGYKMKDAVCEPICPHGRTGKGCSQDCPPNKWGPNCVYDCKPCTNHGTCSPVTGECQCHDGWQGESCETSISTTPTPTTMKELLTTTKSAELTTPIPSESSTAFPTSPEKITNTASTKTSSTAQTITTPILTTKSTPAYINSSLKLTTKSYGINESKNVIKTESISNKTDVSQSEGSKSTPTLATIPVTTTTKQSPTETMTRDLYTKTTLSTSMSPTNTRAETTIKTTTTKLIKQKEIWIKPAQKGDSSIIEVKKPVFDLPTLRHKNATKKDLPPLVTTPRTIIVSIIPTVMTHSTFRKLAPSTSPVTSFNTITTPKSVAKSKTNSSSKLLEKSTIVKNWSPIFVKNLPTTTMPSIIKNKEVNVTTSNPTLTSSSVTMFRTNSMKGMTSGAMRTNYSSHIYLTTPAPKHKNFKAPSTSTIASTSVATARISISTETASVTVQPLRNSTKRDLMQHSIPNPKVESVLLTKLRATDATLKESRKVTEIPLTREHTTNKLIRKQNSTEDETFPILTEPEQITAIAGDKPRSSVDLISVISIAGGVVMAVITVAVVIVMMERCRKTRYDNLMKMEELRMRKMIDNDVPPPYVRSIFHTPLPAPPSMEKSHYQPISTLDRNLKQFMRPVVVQTISPVMMENFREILECHYDHLPRRSHEFRKDHCNTRCSVPPSIDKCTEPLCSRVNSITESTIEDLKCEAKVDILDSSTSEPLYAEIPFWRPPSEHAVEILNLNGEAVTEL